LDELDIEPFYTMDYDPVAYLADQSYELDESREWDESDESIEWSNLKKMPCIRVHYSELAIP